MFKLALLSCSLSRSALISLFRITHPIILSGLFLPPPFSARGARSTRIDCMLSWHKLRYSVKLLTSASSSDFKSYLTEMSWTDPSTADRLCTSRRMCNISSGASAISCINEIRVLAVDAARATTPATLATIDRGSAIFTRALCEEMGSGDTLSFGRVRYLYYRNFVNHFLNSTASN